MKKLYLLKCLVGFFILSLSLSCKKGEISNLNEVPIKNQKKIVNSIPAFSFDWENVDYMPTPSGAPVILVPWASGSNQMFTPDIAFDFRKSDGWELVYNTFSTTTPTSPSFFALYNKYRGLLKFYIYLPPGSLVPSSYLNHGLSLSGSGSSSMLNYIGQDKVNLTTNVTATTQIENYQIQSTGAWYAAQYEIAYDPDIANTSQSNLNMVWDLQAINITQIKIDGTTNGTVKTPVAQPNSSSSINLSGLPTAAGKGAVSLYGLSVLGSDPKTTGLRQDIWSALNTALKSGVGGVVTGVLNAIFGGSSSTQAVNLVMSSTLELTGSLTNSSGINKPTLIIPGSANSQNAVGYVPAYDKIMGTFKLTNNPIVKITRKTIRGASLDDSSVQFTIQLDKTSYQKIFNPELLNIASIQNIKEEVIAVYASEDQTFSVLSFPGTYEHYGEKVVFGSLTSMITKYGVALPQGLSVRVSFDVVPNNGAPTVTVVKTFTCQPQVTNIF